MGRSGIRVSARQIAEHYGCHLATAKRWLAAMERAGLAQREPSLVSRPVLVASLDDVQSFVEHGGVVAAQPVLAAA